jgi:tripartite-type tricarboxylate transporter receptor subunit TctC
MRLSRRRFLSLATATFALPAISRIAAAQAYPNRPVRIIVPFPAGGVSDILARQIGQWLAERLGQPFIIENRPGAGSNLGSELVAKAPPDGYTLLNLSSANAVNATLYERLNFNFVRDIAPVAGLAGFHYVMDINPSLPINTLPEFIAYAKTNPGKLSMASNGIGTASHLAGELFKLMAGVDMPHVPYRGAAQALPDLIGGQVQVMFDSTASSIEHIRAGKLRALAVTSATRLEVLPDTPTVGEVLTGYEASAWWGFGVPRHTPAEIVGKLNKEINAGLADPKIKARLVDLGGTVLAGSPGDFGKLIADETEKWAKVVKFAGLKPD